MPAALPPLPKPRLILASTSPYRAELLARLRLPFSAVAPGSDETAEPGEIPRRLAQRLALAKARAVAATHPDAWVLGSDQVASCDGAILGKPGSRAAAIEQLQQLAGRPAKFFTAVALVCLARGEERSALDVTRVRLRKLPRATIERYVDAEPAYDCAGAAKIEGLGIALCKEVESRDPTALIGLPLIATARLLRRAGFELP